MTKELKLIQMKPKGIKDIIEVDETTKKQTIVGVQLKVLEDYTNKNNEISTKEHTVKVMKVFSEKEKESIFNHSIEINETHNLKDYIFQYGKKGFTCDNLKVLEKDNDIDFNYSYAVSGVIRSATSGKKTLKDTGKEISTTSFNLELQNGFELKLITIKVLDEVKDFQKLIGKELKFENIESIKVDMNTYLSTDTAPKLVK